MAPGFCAICLASIANIRRREPLGKDDGMVAVCDGCAGEVITPKERINARMMRPPDATTSRAAQIRERRAKLTRDGFCINGRNHGPPLPGRRICAYCDDVQKKHNEVQTRSVPDGSDGNGEHS